ncbi:putative O-glycosylation ligase, exosortase A system-associated [Falsiroseomonas bella]|uniref:Putative O-glycosylation ligase, exosortase A system-associated n=1 Tax=Falsiroseomonas bella TaxID=2184016 RepID=A0A317FKW4_9PROT|nr:putative O-glycosylation ligase, exosortase A system-associated [Falsiroseomonas bella]PWS39203.1 putative O-glycosylation ligase, exosortase A system-associated [Falsiroseomonas bella]
MRSYVFFAVYLGLLAPALVQPFLGALLWSWIAFMNPHREVWGFATNLPYAMTIFLAMLVACVIAKEPKRFDANGVTVLLLLFAAIFTLTTITGIGPSEVMWRRWEANTKVVIGALLVASLLTTRRRIHAMVWLMVISIGYYGVKGGIFTAMTGGGFRVMGPPDTMIADRNHMAVALLVSVPLMNYLRLHSRHYIARLGLLAAMGLTLLAAVGSQSRGALLALGATAAVLWWRSKKKVVSAIVLFGCILAILAFMPDSWALRMNSILDYDSDASAMGRLRIWWASWLIALQYPLTGVGFRAMYYQHIVNLVAPDVNARAVHSIYFEVLGEHGFPGFFVWLGLTVAGIYYAQRLMRITRDRPDLAWAGDLGRMVQVSIVAYLAGGAFLSLSYWDYYWMILIVTAAAHTIAVRAIQADATSRGMVGAGAWKRSSMREAPRGAVRGAAT